MGGCSKKNYSGIVDDVKIISKDNAEVELIITINENKDREYYYPTVTICNYHFEMYSCDNLNDLLTNKEFLEESFHTGISFNSGTTNITCPNGISSFAYILIYEGSETFEGTLLPIADQTNYIGCIKF